MIVAAIVGASEGDAVILQHQGKDYFLMFGIISQFMIIKLLVDVDQSLHTRRMVPQVLLV